MSTVLDALYAQVKPAPAPVVFSLVEMDRRRAGDALPTIPVAGLELTPGEAAAALFETAAEDLALPVPSTDALYDALNGAVRVLGPVGIAEHTPTFEGLCAEEFPEVRDCRRFAYRLALSFWYQDARSRPMTAGEVAVAVYLSSLNRHRRDQFLTPPRRKLLLARAIHEGATAVPTETLIRLGKAMAAELRGPGHDREKGRDWLYKQALPDYHRRRFAFDVTELHRSQPAPLIVRPDSGGYLIGLTPPAGPDGIWQRPNRAEW